MENKFKFVLMSILILGLLTSATTINFPTNAEAQTDDFDLVAFSGDWSCNSQANNSWDQVKASDPDLIIINGDLSYGSNLDCFTGDIEDRNLKEITKAVIGNHDSSEDGSSSIEEELKDYWKLPSRGYDAYRHIMDNGKTAYIYLLNTQSSLSSSSSQYQWLDQNLTGITPEVQSGNIQYVIFVTHKMIWNGGSCADHGQESYAQTVRDLMYKHGDIADVFTMGHDHNFQLSKPMKTSNAITTNTDISGVSFVVAGLPGRTADSASGCNSQTLDALGGSSNHGVAYLKLYHDEKKIDIYFKTNSGTTKAQHTLLDAGSIVPPPPPQVNAVIKPDFPSGIPNQTIALDGSQSVGATPIQYVWEKINGDITIIQPNEPVTPIKILSEATPGSSATVKLTVTDANGISDTEQTTIAIIGSPLPPPPVNTTYGKLNIVSSDVPNADSGKEGPQSYDNDCSTRVSFNGVGETATYHFNDTYSIQDMKINGYHDSREYYFKIFNGSEPDKVYTIGLPRDLCPELIPFDLKSQNLNASSITIIGEGNSGTDYNSYRELEFFGGKIANNTTNPPPPIEECGDNIDNDGDGLVDEDCPSELELSNNVTVLFSNDTSKIENAYKLNSSNFTIFPTLNNTEITILTTDNKTNNNNCNCTVIQPPPIEENNFTTIQVNTPSEIKLKSVEGNDTKIIW